ncbi:MAG: sigma-54-dependent Fis family transcriptional regulator [Spirochaetia bacterium]|jgi:transcriptional regulator of acetoin/glycerol metabolism
MSPDTFLYTLWKRFVVEKQEVEPGAVRPCILESWQRCRAFGVDPCRNGECVSVEPAELSNRRALRADLLDAAVPYLHELYKIIEGSKSVITLSDEDGVVLEAVTDEEIMQFKAFPRRGTVHSEKVNGTNGIGTSLANGSPIQIRAEEHWLKDNHAWACNGAPIRRDVKLIGSLNLSCPLEVNHEHSLGLIVASVKAIERELDLKASLAQKQSLIQQQNAVLELLDTGIILIDRDGMILSTNRTAREILRTDADVRGRPVAEIIPAHINFLSLMSSETALSDQETVLRLKGKDISLSFSTALVRNATGIEAMVIRVRESKTILKMVHRFTGSRAIYSFDDILGSSPGLCKCVELAKTVSRSNLNVLILGESGTGKELFAHAIHANSICRNGPFVAINCGALSRDLIQSELFGYEGGAFTGAKKEGNPGKIELADGGTLFLDEIGELPLDAQVNLLRVLETGEVSRLGGKYAKAVTVRVIAATNKDIYRAISEKVFREDLFYRINTFVLTLPPLRERVADIRTLVNVFLERSSRSMGRNLKGIEADVLSIFERYRWPGNIRELANTIDRAIAVAETPLIRVSDLPPLYQALESDRSENELGSGRNQDMDQLLSHLEETKGNLREVARRMGVARSTVYNMMRRYQIPLRDFR